MSLDPGAHAAHTQPRHLSLGPGVSTEDFFTLRNNSRHKNPSFCRVQFSVVSVRVASTYTDSTSNFRLYGSARAIRIVKPHFVFIFSQTRDTMPCPSRDLSMVNIGWAKL